MQAQQKSGKDAGKTKGTKAITDKKGKESTKAEEAIVEQAKNAVKEAVKGATKKIAALDEDDISDDEDEELDSEDEDEDEETAALLAAMSDSDDEEASEVACPHLCQSWVYFFVARISSISLALGSTCMTKSKPTAVKGRLESGVVTYIMLAPWFQSFQDYKLQSRQMRCLLSRKRRRHLSLLMGRGRQRLPHLSQSRSPRLDKNVWVECKHASEYQ